MVEVWKWVCSVWSCISDSCGLAVWSPVRELAEAKRVARITENIQAKKGIHLLNFHKFTYTETNLLEIWRLVVCQKSEQETHQSNRLPMCEHRR